MPPLHAILLGILQGITEFLPVSSTAHMDIAPQLLGWPDPGAAFSAIAQLGPMIAIIYYFRHDLVRYWHGIVRSKRPGSVKADDVDARLGWFTLLGSLPIMVFGFLLQHRIETTFRSLNLVAAALIALALVLWAAEATAAKRTPLDAMNLKQSQVVGWAQVLALIPGTSRSGVTITAGLFEGLDRESAARFSFLLSIPAITAAGLFQLVKVVAHHQMHGLFSGVAAALVAGVLAYGVIRWFLGFMKEHNTGVFIVYRILLGLFILFAVHTGRIHKLAPKQDATPATGAVALPANDSSVAPSAPTSDGTIVGNDHSNPS